MLPANLTKITFINFCTRFHLYIHAYALLLQQRGLSLLQISTIESVVIGTIFLAEVPTGVLADRIGRKWSVAAATFFLMCAELLFLFSRSYPAYLVVAVLTGTGFAFMSGAMESLVYDSLPPEDRANAMKQVMGRVGSWGQIAFFLSPIIGGWIIADLQPERFNAAIALTVAALFVGFLASLTLKEPPTAWQSEASHPLTIFRGGIAEVTGNRQLQRLVLVVVLMTPFGGTLVTTFAAPYLSQNAVPAFMIGLALSVGSLLAAVTQRYAYRVEQVFGRRWGLVLLMTLPGFMYWLLASISGPGAVWLVIVLMYGTNDMKHPLISAYQNAMIRSENRATVLSLINMMSSLFVAVVAPMYAAVAIRSLPLAFVLIGSVIIIVGVVLRVDRLMGEAEEIASIEVA